MIMKGQCIPRFKSNSFNNKITKTTSSSHPMSLLERFREAVLRLMMLSALSKATENDSAGSDVRQRRFGPNDNHHSEAVADCIEFIKRKAAAEENRHSSASSAADYIHT